MYTPIKSSNSAHTRLVGPITENAQIPHDFSSEQPCLVLQLSQIAFAVLAKVAAVELVPGTPVILCSVLRLLVPVVRILHKPPPHQEAFHHHHRLSLVERHPPVIRRQHPPAPPQLQLRTSHRRLKSGTTTPFFDTRRNTMRPGASGSMLGLSSNPLLMHCRETREQA